MEKKRELYYRNIRRALILIGAACAGTVYYYLLPRNSIRKDPVYIYIDRDDTADSIYNKVKQQGHPRSFTGSAGWPNTRNIPKTYTPDATPSGRRKMYIVFSRLYRGYQEPMNLTVGSVRTLDRLARSEIGDNSS